MGWLLKIIKKIRVVEKVRTLIIITLGRKRKQWPISWRNRCTERNGWQSFKEQIINQNNSKSILQQQTWILLHPKFQKIKHEILTTMSDKKGSQKHTTYLCLVDLGTSGSLVSREIVEYTSTEMKIPKGTNKVGYHYWYLTYRWFSTHCKLLLTSVHKEASHNNFLSHVQNAF
jgi:hypothetical protein